MATTRALGRTAGTLSRALARAAVIVALAVVIGVAVGAAAGRWRLTPAPDRAAANGFDRNDLFVAVPVPARNIRVGDVVVVHNEHAPSLYTISAIDDSASMQVRFAGDAKGQTRHLHSTVWRVRFAVPLLGALLGLVAGPVQCAILVLIGIGLIVAGERKRARLVHAPALVR